MSGVSFAIDCAHFHSKVVILGEGAVIARVSSDFHERFDISAKQTTVWLDVFVNDSNNFTKCARPMKTNKAGEY